jgi:hypothetical protein
VGISGSAQLNSFLSKRINPSAAVTKK